MQAAEARRAVAAATVDRLGARPGGRRRGRPQRLQPAGRPPDALRRRRPGLAHRRTSPARSERSSSCDGSRRRTARSPRSILGSSRASSSATASRSPCGPTSTGAVPRAPAGRLRAGARAPARRPAADRRDDAALHGSHRGDATDVASRDVTPDLADADRALLADTLRDLRRSIVDRRRRRAAAARRAAPVERARHRATGRSSSTSRTPPAGRSSTTWRGCPSRSASATRTPTEALLDECRGVVLAIIAAHRWRRDDQHPSGRRSGVAFLDALRDGPPWPALDDVTW